MAPLVSQRRHIHINISGGIGFAWNVVDKGREVPAGRKVGVSFPRRSGLRSAQTVFTARQPDRTADRLLDGWFR
jgi:hypothetical protein